MKKIILPLLLFVIFGAVVRAQKISPEIKEGTVMNASVFVQGQGLPLQLSVKSLNKGVTLAWLVEGFGDGTFVISANALENGTKMFTSSQPALGETKLADDETFGVISKAAFKLLTATKSFTYSGLKFNLKVPSSAPIKIKDKEVDAINVISEDGKFEFWILNNPSFPLILKSSGLAIDIAIAEIK